MPRAGRLLRAARPACARRREYGAPPAARGRRAAAANPSSSARALARHSLGETRGPRFWPAAGHAPPWISRGESRASGYRRAHPGGTDPRRTGASPSKDRIVTIRVWCLSMKLWRMSWATGYERLESQPDVLNVLSPLALGYLPPCCAGWSSDTEVRSPSTRGLPSRACSTWRSQPISGSRILPTAGRSSCGATGWSPGSLSKAVGSPRPRSSGPIDGTRRRVWRPCSFGRTRRKLRWCTRGIPR